MVVRIGDIMTRRPVTIPAGASLAEAAALMAAKGVGGLPVVEDGRLVGMVTEEDVVRRLMGTAAAGARAAGAGSRKVALAPNLARRLAAMDHLPVESVMTTAAPAVSPSTPIEQVATLMLRHGVTRLPVLAWGSVVGIASQSDIVAAAAGRRHTAGAHEARFGWRFLDTRRRLAEAGGLSVTPGLLIHCDPDRVAFEEAPAAYPDILDAMAHARGLTVCRVRLSGLIAGHDGRHVATEWECLWVSSAGVAVASWAAAALDRALQLQLADGLAVDPLIRDALRPIAQAAAGTTDEAGVSRAIRAIRAARRDGLQVPGVARALDAVVEAAQAALAAREAPARDVSVWEGIATEAAWDAAHEAVRAMGPAEAEDQRHALEEAVLAAAPLAVGAR